MPSARVLTAVTFLAFRSWAAAQPPTTAAPDVAQIVQKSVDVELVNYDIAKNYTFTEHTQIEKITKDGQARSTETAVKEVFMLFGQPYERLVEKNGKPLSPKEEQKEQEKLDKLTRERQSESPEKRQARLAKVEKDREEDRVFRREIPKAFDFRYVGTDTVNGRPAWVL
ncbi:MAG TPA: hypothetical protein VE621_05120, partial [Bryobacteraceae bacterium]|nr:hypothetical protein [Bryobacteraceae bacterium]